jgi:hypothetical protein
MKKINLILISSLLFSLSIFSQNGYNNRISSPLENEINQEKYQENIEKTRAENLEKYINQLTTDLNLNELQVIAIKQIYSESSKKQGIIMKKEISDEDKLASLKSLAESAEKKVLELLEMSQKEKYELLKVEKPKEKKKKKEKKSKQ